MKSKQRPNQKAQSAAEREMREMEVYREKLRKLDEPILDRMCRAAGIADHPLMKHEEKVTAMVGVRNSSRRYRR